MLIGCGTLGYPPSYPAPLPPTYPDDPNPTEPTPSPAPPPSPPKADTTAATLALLDDSERARETGDYTSASNYLQRAIRLEPRRADLWTQLARLQLDRNDPAAAQRYAHKAISLAGTRADWKRDAWLVIADSKAASGDSQEAQEIRNRWRTYEG